MTEQYDDAIVGAGIMGLAHAYLLARRGRRVIVFERHARARGASVRNFGMLWPIGQPDGEWHQRALRSRMIWLEVLRESGLWHEMTGSLHLAYHDDEATVLEEFIGRFSQRESGRHLRCEWKDPAGVLAMSTVINPANLRGGMWSSAEICVDPREILAGLPGWLQRTYGVRFEFNRAVTAYEHPHVLAGEQRWRASRLFVCSGDDFQTLFPEVFAGSGLSRCKLQMLRTRPLDLRLGPLLAGGLTLAHYPAFRDCPSLPALKWRIAGEMPAYLKYGIHVMAAQHARGDITIGDSHEYGIEITPFDNPEIDRLILAYLQSFLLIPRLEIESRWHGVYAKHPSETCYITRPAAGVTIIASPGGAGMTLSFGIAAKVVSETLGEH
ncbi:MAG: TIGR03364 family FAD-dependent oxidoreductase [Blastocatellia bacterium]